MQLLPLRLCLCLQIPQQPFQRLLVVVVALPPGEVADMPGATNVCCPRFCGLHHALIYTNRKEHLFVMLALFFKSSFDFLFHPLAPDRVFREDEQQFIIEANRLINTMPYFVTDCYVLWGKPAADTSTLEISIEPLSERLVLAGIANETTIVIDGSPNERMDIVNEGVWHASTPQEDVGNVTL